MGGITFYTTGFRNVCQPESKTIFSFSHFTQGAYLLGLLRSGVDTAWFVHVTMADWPGCVLSESSVATVRLTGCIETWLLPKLSPNLRLQKLFNLATSRIESDDWESKNRRNVGNYLPVDDSS
jgi:hypothetical protein